MTQKKCAPTVNFTFSEKEVFCEIYSSHVMLLGKYTSNLIKNEPWHILFSQTWDQLFNRIITIKNIYI